MRAFGGGGSRDSACRRFRDAEGTRRGWNFDAASLWCGSVTVCPHESMRAGYVARATPSSSRAQFGTAAPLSFPRWETAPTVPRGGRFGRAPGSLMRRRLDAVSALASALCEALPRARLAELAGAPGRDVPASPVSSRDPRSRRGASRSRAPEPPPAPTPRAAVQRARRASRAPLAREDAAVPARARRVTIRAPRERGRPRLSRRARALVGDRGRGPCARETPPRRRARVLRVPRRGRRVTRAARRRRRGSRPAARRPGGSPSRRHERDPRRREILRHRGRPPDDDKNTTPHRSRGDSTDGCLGGPALPEAGSLAQLTPANADAGGSHPRDVVERLGVALPRRGADPRARDSSTSARGRRVQALRLSPREATSGEARLTRSRTPTELEEEPRRRKRSELSRRKPSAVGTSPTVATT